MKKRRFRKQIMGMDGFKHWPHQAKMLPFGEIAFESSNQDEIQLTRYPQHIGKKSV